MLDKIDISPSTKYFKTFLDYWIPARLRIFVLLVVATLTNAICASSQQSISDSLLVELSHAKSDTSKVKILNQLCSEESQINLENSLKYGNDAYQLSIKNEYWDGAFIAKRYLGKAYHNFNQIENAVKETNNAIQLSEKYPIKYREIALAYNELGAICEEDGKYSKAIENYQNALKFAELGNDQFILGVLFINMSVVFFDLAQYQEAIAISEKAVTKFEQLAEPYYVGLAYQMIGEANIRLENWQSAAKYLNKAVTIFENVDAIDRMGEALNGLGILYQYLGEWDKSLHYYNLSLAIDDSLGNSQFKSLSYANIAGVYSEMNQLDTALVLLQKSLELAEDEWEMKYLMTTYLYTAQTYEENGNFESAYKFHKLYDIVKDSIFSFEKKIELIKIQEELNVKLQDERIFNLQLENEKISSKSKLNYLILSLGIAVLAIIILLILLYLKHYRTKMTQSKNELKKSIAELKSTALMSQLNPHLVFNILNSIQGLVSNQEIEKTNRYISKFSKFMRQTLQMNQLNHIYIEAELDILKQYFDLEKLRFGNKIQLECDNRVEQNKLRVPPLILQPIIENSIKHGILPFGHNGLIKVKICQQEDYYQIEISDNGNGFDKHKEFRDGLRITLERLKMLNAENNLSIKNYMDPTIIELTIKKA